MSTQPITPKYHWTFAEISNSVTNDTISSVSAQLSNVVMSGQGRIGNAIALNGSDNSFLSLGRDIGQFGQADFTIAFGVKIAKTAKLIELLGNRTSVGHGSFFCIRVTPTGQIVAEVDEDAKGTNYIGLESVSGFDDNTWHHITVVRQKNELSLYINGSLSREKPANGVANVANSNDLRTGNANPALKDAVASPKAEFEDLRIYDRALSDAQIIALVPPLIRGEIELTLADKTPKILKGDVADLGQPTSPFEKLKLGFETGVTLYQNANFSGTAQDVAANLPKLSETRLGAPPRSIRVWSTLGRPFTGQWAFLAPNGQYLSLAYSSLSTSPCITPTEQFAVVRQPDLQWLEIIPGSSSASAGIQISPGVSSTLFCVEEEVGFRRFSLVNQQRDRWLKFVLGNRIALKSFNGKYVRAADGGGGAVLADRDYPLSDELFNLVSVANNRVALATVRKGLYLSAVNGGGGAVNAQIPKLDIWETFILEKLEGNKIALKTASKNLYICAEGGGGRELVANRQQRDIWETFEQVNLGGFDWTTNKDERAIFTSAIKLADHESKVGELLPGEVAFYENSAYWGKTWVLYDSYSDFRTIQGFNDVVSSVRLGPETGATLYVNPAYGTTTSSQDREKDVEDIVENVPDLRAAQIGSDKLSSVKVWRSIAPKQANIDVSVTLSQDYKLVAGEDELQEFSSYRSILKFLPEVTEVEVWATDLTQIEVDGQHYDVDEDRSVKLTPNGMSRLMITSEAEGINTAGLKIHTNTMKNFERVVLFPDREVHRQIAGLEDGALWNAKILVSDSSGSQKQKEEWLVKRDASTSAQVQAVQNTISSMMRTVSYVSADHDDENQLIDREITADAIDRPRGLQFSKPRQTLSAGSTASNAIQIQETDIQQDELLEMINGAASAPLAQGWKNAWRSIKSAVKNAASVVVGVVEKVVHVIVKTVQKVGEGIGKVIEKIEDWIIDTAEKAGAFVEGVVEKIGVVAKQFVEYLRSLFNWDDILATQNALASKVNEGFDLAQEAAIAAIAPVNALVDTVKNAVDSGLDETLNRLRKDTEKIDQQPKLPEALEWLLSKLTSKSSSFSDTTKAVSSSPSETDPIAAFFSTFKSGSKAIVDILLTGLAGLGRTIALLITAPTQPQFAVIALLEMIKDVVSTAFDFIKSIAEAFLNCIASAIGRFKSLINAEINIPFITAFFKKVLKIDKFNLLTLTTLLLAIPVTVTYKLLAGSEAKLALSKTVSVQGWMVTGFIADTINGLVTSLLDAGAESLGFEVVSTLLQFFSWMSSFPASPDPRSSDSTSIFDGGHPYNVASYKVTEDKNPTQYWERVMWGWRSFALGIDVVALLVAKTRIKRAIHKKDPKKVEETVDKTMPVLAMLFAAIDLGITTKYLVTSLNDNAKEGDSRATKTHKESIRQSGEYIGIFPSFFAFLNYGSPQSKLALGAIDLVCAGVVSGLKGEEMRRDFQST